MRKQPNKNTKAKRNAKEAPRPRRSRSLNPFATKLSAHVTDEGEWITEPPNLTLSRMFLVVLLLHIVIVGGILAFEMFKEESVAPSEASATPMTESRDSLGTNTGLGEEALRYRVQAGDTISRIAKNHHVSSSHIKAMNRLGGGDEIYPGQILSIPGGVRPSQVPTPAIPERGSEADVVAAALRGDVIPDGAQVFTPREGTGSPVAVSGVVAPTPNIVSVPPVAPPVTPPATNAKSHKVQPGETAYAISRRYGITVGALLKKNGITDANLLHVGNVLQIP